MSVLAAVRRPFLFFALFLSVCSGASAQYEVRGTVYDSSYVRTVEAVTVQATNGRGTVTDSKGAYRIPVGESDSVWFSYLGKPTRKFPVRTMPDPTRFDVALQTYDRVLEEVRIRNRSYREDSLQNRRDYAKVFDFRKPSLGSMTSIGPMGAGIDIQELIRAFQFRKNRSTMAFQERLLEQERAKYIDFRFNRGLVRRLTGLEGEDLERFMIRFRPTYDFVLLATEYDFRLYIRRSAEGFRRTF